MLVSLVTTAATINFTFHLFLFYLSLMAPLPPLLSLKPNSLFKPLLRTLPCMIQGLVSLFFHEALILRLERAYKPVKICLSNP